MLVAKQGEIGMADQSADKEKALSELLRLLGQRLDAIANREADAALLGLLVTENTAEKRRLIKQMEQIVDDLENLNA
jgi:hypothetical protein